jgi:hypothetical protein
MTQSGKNMMVLGQDCVVIVAELLTSASATRLLSGWLTVLASFN